MRVLFESKRSTFLAVVFVALIVKVGVWPRPDYEWTLQVAVNPFANPWPGDPLPQYHLWSWLLPLIAHWLQIRHVETLFALNLVWVIAFFTLAMILSFKRLRESEARAATLILVMLPASTSILLWVGGDGLVLLLFLIALCWPQHLWLSILMGLLIGLQHFEQGLIATGLLLVSLVIGRFLKVKIPTSLTPVAALAVSIIGGNLLLRGLFTWLEVGVEAGRSAWIDAHLEQMLSQFGQRWQLIVFSVLGVLWLMIVLNLARTTWRNLAPVTVVLASSIPVLAFVFDQTRVAALITFPTIAVWWLWNRDFLVRLSGNAVASLWVVWLVVPIAWVWMGTPRWSVFGYDVLLAYNLLTGSEGLGGVLDRPFAP